MVAASRPCPPPRLYARALIGSKRTKAAAKRERLRRIREADAAIVAGAWARVRPWCEEVGLGAFYAEADRRGVRFERAHADDGAADWDRFQLGKPKGRAKDYPPVARLWVGDTEFRLHRRTDQAPMNLYADGVLIASWGFHAAPHGRYVPAATVDAAAELSPEAEELIDLTIAPYIGALMRRMSAPAYGGDHAAPFYLPADTMVVST